VVEERRKLARAKIDGLMATLSARLSVNAHQLIRIGGYVALPATAAAVVATIASVMAGAATAFVRRAGMGLATFVLFLTRE
jgi:hypothetical protein